MDEPVGEWNLGTGHGHDRARDAARLRAGVGPRAALPRSSARRPGDVAGLLRRPGRAHAELGWRATRTIDDMCVDTWRWQSANPTGYPDA